MATNKEDIEETGFSIVNCHRARSRGGRRCKRAE
jgi:hypothetical protein